MEQRVMDETEITDNWEITGGSSVAVLDRPVTNTADTQSTVIQSTVDKPAKKVTVIPASRRTYSSEPITSVKKRKTAGYARVSTDREEQASSYETQMKYYKEYIESQPDMEFVGMYSDEGISATSTAHREGFKKMIADAMDGKIDLIITKSVSRFARNTVDSLTAIRQLREKGVEVYFEKENIWTFDSKGELLITIMSSLAQEESRSISENVKWGKRKQFAKGRGSSVACSHFLGYDKGSDGGFVVNPEEAKIVKLIFKLFLEGMTPYHIAEKLEELGIKTTYGKDKWHSSTVSSILQNEKYKGDLLLQKKYTVDFLTKKVKKNEGEVQQYYVKGDHEAIIDPATFDLVQEEIARRKSGKIVAPAMAGTAGTVGTSEVAGSSGKMGESMARDDGATESDPSGDSASVSDPDIPTPTATSAPTYRYSGARLFSSKIRCGCCGAMFGSKVWHSNDKYRKIVYRCNRKYDNGEKCTSGFITEEEIKHGFVSAVNKVLGDKKEIISNIKSMKEEFCNTDDLEKELAECDRAIRALTVAMGNYIDQNARNAVDQEEYSERFSGLEEQYEIKRSEYDRLREQNEAKKSEALKIDKFISELKKQEDLIEEFDLDLWSSLVDYVTVYDRENVVFTFVGGIDVKAE